MGTGWSCKIEPSKFHGVLCTFQFQKGIHSDLKRVCPQLDDAEEAFDDIYVEGDTRNGLERDGEENQTIHVT